jgi:hypothetical protein
MQPLESYKAPNCNNALGDSNSKKAQEFLSLQPSKQEKMEFFCPSRIKIKDCMGHDCGGLPS